MRQIFTIIVFALLTSCATTPAARQDRMQKIAEEASKPGAAYSINSLCGTPEAQTNAYLDAYLKFAQKSII